MASTAGSGAARRHLVPAAPNLFFFFVFAGAMLVLHWPYLRLPYFWYEMGQFVPAARDIVRDGAWIPQSPAPNVHPPGVMAFVALVWRVAGFSISATRLAMLLIAAVGLLFVFILGIELGRPGQAMSALLVPVLLLFSPLFYTQGTRLARPWPHRFFHARSFAALFRCKQLTCRRILQRFLQFGLCFRLQK
jgi:hypothetical protein